MAGLADTHPDHGARPAVVSPLHPAARRMPSVAIVSTFPPTHCGLATFAAALANGLKSVGVKHLGIIEATDGTTCSLDPRVSGRLVAGEPRSVTASAREINNHDFVIIQHEFGIYGGQDGAEVLDLLDDVYVPVVVTLHTVPLDPSPGQRRVLEALASRADVLVTMTEAAQSRLSALYDVDGRTVVNIPHGATVPKSFGPPEAGNLSLLTWGLIGPGKGLEWVIEAIAMTPELRPRLKYVIAGQTHPKVLANEGERYRNMLRKRVTMLGLEDVVTFDDEYRSLPSLLGLIEKSSCVVLPYDSHDQITSGVLVDAISAGRPVIATQFPHAMELVSPDIGIVVPHRDPVSIAAAIRDMAQDPSRLIEMSLATQPVAREHRWTTVAAQYANLVTRFADKESLIS